MPPRLILKFLGSPQIQLDDKPAAKDHRKVIALLAYLAVNDLDRSGQRYSRESLSALFWPDYEQAKAFSNLRRTLWEVNQVLGEGWLIADRESVQFNPEADPSTGSGWQIDLDVARFLNLLARSRQQAQREPAIRIDLLSDAVNLYRDHFLTGFSLKDAPNFNEWAFGESEDLRHQLSEALTHLSEDHCSLGQADRAIPYARRLVTLDPLNEASHRKLMQVYLQAGQHSAALKQFQTCEQILRKELGVDPEPETYALYKQIRKGEIKPVRISKPVEQVLPRHNLPASLTTFVGREKEQAEILQLIGAHRLVTLTGSGGVGKTRTSLQVGGQVLAEYADGVWLAELAPLGDPELLPQTVASIFGILAQSATASYTQLVTNFLRSKTTLLILDNCEHLLDATAFFADTLLKHCPGLKILATSREALGILGEVVYHMPSLGLPDIQQTLETFRAYESVRLFEERARLAQPDFKLTLENAASVAQICSRLDGIPLAIELAAARVNMFSTAQIAARLDDRFHLLTGGSRTALPRQQTLRASIDWSWNLISDAERALLRRLTVFAGGWILEAAQAVCSPAGDPQPVLEWMTQLLAKSLVIADRQPGREQRFHLHETIREYAQEKLVEAGEQEHILSQHLKYYLDLSERAERALHGPDQIEWYQRLTDERDNLRVALAYASRPDASTADLEAGLTICAKLVDYWVASDYREGLRWSTEFIQNPASQTFPLARAKALMTQGWLLWSMQQFEAVRSIAEDCLALFRSYGDRVGEYDALILMGNMRGFAADREQRAESARQALALARSMGDVLRQAFALFVLGWDQREPERAREVLEEAVVLFRQAGDWRFLAQALGILGLTVLSNGDLESAEGFLDEAYEVNQRTNQSAMEFVLTGKGLLCVLRGDYGGARLFLQQNIDNLEKMGNQMGVLWGRARLGYVVLRQGSLREAQQILVDTIQNFHTNGNKNGLAFTLDKMASLYVLTDKPEVAARLIGCSDATRQEIGDPRPRLEQQELDRDIAAIKTKVGAGAYEVAYSTGQGLTLDEAVAFAAGGS